VPRMVFSLRRDVFHEEPSIDTRQHYLKSLKISAYASLRKI
jgi:hypothetical protein